MKHGRHILQITLLGLICVFMCACQTEDTPAISTMSTATTAPSRTGSWEYWAETEPTIDIYAISYTEENSGYYDLKQIIQDIPRFDDIKRLPAFNRDTPLASEADRREYANLIFENLNDAGYKHLNPYSICYFMADDVAIYCFENLTVTQSSGSDRPAYQQTPLDGGDLYFAVDCKTGRILHIGYGYW